MRAWGRSYSLTRSFSLCVWLSQGSRDTDGVAGGASCRGPVAVSACSLFVFLRYIRACDSCQHPNLLSSAPRSPTCAARIPEKVGKSNKRKARRRQTRQTKTETQSFLHFSNPRFIEEIQNSIHEPRVSEQTLFGCIARSWPFPFQPKTILVFPVQCPPRSCSLFLSPQSSMAPDSLLSIEDIL